MSFELLKTTLGEEHFINLTIIPTENVGEIFEDWLEKMGGIVFGRMEADVLLLFMAEVGEKMYVSYITGKTRILQRWARSFQELPPCCPCPEQV